MTGSRSSFTPPTRPGLPPLSGEKPETLEEIAHRVLFSESLEEKLRGFRLEQSEVNSRPVPGIHHRDLVPGRPASLRFAASGALRPALPSSPALVEEESRGVLLHFFANHELLAAELMALALLRFPDAPAAFRVGLANTLREEQRHTYWYVQRMKQCGVEFGQYPLNRFFWDAVCGMEEPIDYVSRLSLTFEQANLDYARHFAGLLGEAGDPASSALLRRIYEDEITHVGYGLHWFRRWKDEAESDWEALSKRLFFPLSPSRAKGNRTEFNTEGRRKAGFDDEYIRTLALFERSNGRTPNVFYFNPDAENRVAAMPNPYHPRKQIHALTRDLEFLCAFLSRRDDVALLRKLPDVSHLSKLREAGFVLPELEGISGSGLTEGSLLRERKINTFQPWAKAPDLTRQFPSFGESPNRQALWEWRDSDRDLYSKQEQAREFARWFGPSFPIHHKEDLSTALQEFRTRGIRTLVWKRSIGNAGAGMQRLSLEEWEELLARSETPDLTREGGFLLEPGHDRLFDFSMQFEMKEGELRCLGSVEQVINETGGYRGSISMPRLTQGQAPELARFLATKALRAYGEGGELRATLRRWALKHRYEGPIGIDSYIHRGPDGELLHRPVCEVNMRYTMGRVALELKRRVAPGYGIRFEIHKKENAPSELPRGEYRLEKGRLAGGTLILTEMVQDTHLVASVTVAKKRKALGRVPVASKSR